MNTQKQQDGAALAPVGGSAPWIDIPDKPGFWWKHFDGDDRLRMIEVEARDVAHFAKYGDWRGEGVVIKYMGPIAQPALPNAEFCGPSPHADTQTKQQSGSQ